MTMERKLILTDIAGYIPYGLEVNGFGIVTGCNNGRLFFEGETESFLEVEFARPILRPISDLYRTIIHNGKEIVPIVELANLHMPGKTWKLYYGNAVCGDRIFGFIDGGFFFQYEDEPENIEYQFKLFDFLHELKIDYRSLLDAGLAVSCYDLETNPYK